MSRVLSSVITSPTSKINAPTAGMNGKKTIPRINTAHPTVCLLSCSLLTTDLLTFPQFGQDLASLDISLPHSVQLTSDTTILLVILFTNGLILLSSQTFCRSEGGRRPLMK